jgi:hypothetical protein
MTGLRILLIAFGTILATYTAVTIARVGWNFFPVYFGDIAGMSWRGQFDVDFSFFLVLSAIWVMWRHHFSSSGVILGIIAPIGGAVFLSTYLLIASFQVHGDMKALLLGERRARET